MSPCQISSFDTVPGAATCPGQRTTNGTRVPPSRASCLMPRNGPVGCLPLPRACCEPANGAVRAPSVVAGIHEGADLGAVVAGQDDQRVVAEAVVVDGGE